jgi:copper chaperone CopZ
MGLFKKVIGEVPVPGEATVTLPAGKITVNYDEKRMGREADEQTGSNPWLGLPEGLAMTITPAGGGGALTIDSGFGSADFATLKRIGSRFGKVEVPAAGDYVVQVAPVPPSGRELYDPMVKLKG